ncbi:MAG: hypothetical protein BEN19_00400 [Epulopiscium sp. Nuni2H_MBin003]|nr:MAG: hypothetical protein BEN19_00400 [Epulopiscium sp. Nuni2H_MBin003]
MRKIFIEENEVYQIDFSDVVWATDKLNTIFHSAKTPLSDVDFIAETEENIIFVEYKNANISNAVNPTGFKPLDDKKLSQVVKKYYDSLSYIKAIGKGKDKKKVYVYILEAPQADSILRGKVSYNLKNRLPFLLQEQNKFQDSWIDEVKVISIDDWNKTYPQFKLSKIEL